MLHLWQVANIIRLYLQVDIAMFFQLLALLLFGKWYHVLFEALCWHNCVTLRQFSFYIWNSSQKLALPPLP